MLICYKATLISNIIVFKVEEIAGRCSDNLFFCGSSFGHNIKVHEVEVGGPYLSLACGIDYVVWDLMDLGTSRGQGIGAIVTLLV